MTYKVGRIFRSNNVGSTFLYMTGRELVTLTAALLDAPPPAAVRRRLELALGSFGVLKGGTP